jgi:hypothetical protein
LHAEEYALSFVEESLGLPTGELAPASLPRELVETLESALRGSRSGGTEEPFLERMILSFSKQLERESLETRGFAVRKARWPFGAPFAVCLTHDVDNISRPLPHIISVRNRFRARDFFLALLGLKSLYNNISFVAGIEKERGFRSSYYLLTSNYSLKELASSLVELEREGWEAGLHGDFGTHESAESMNDALNRFKVETTLLPSGVREHFLRFDFDKTWEIMDRAGLDYDTTVGFADRLGFPLGLCTPFHPPDKDWRPMRLLELPLVLMDATLWGYLKRDEGEGASDVESMLGRVESVNGLFTLLWHQEAVRMKGGRLYTSILDKLAKRRPFVNSGRAIAGWWRARSVPLRREGREFRLQGAPNGLVISAKTAEGRNLRVHGGKVTVTNGESTIAVEDQNFRMEVE